MQKQPQVLDHALGRPKTQAEITLMGHDKQDLQEIKK